MRVFSTVRACLVASAILVSFVPLHATLRADADAVVVAVQSAIPPEVSQGLPGTWQGILQVPRGRLRIVIIISKNDSSDLRIVMYSIDDGPGATAGSATAQKGHLTLVFPAIRAAFEGRLNAEGNAIDGTWSQSQSVSLTLKKASAETAWAIPQPPAALRAMAADANPSFDAATIRPSSPGDQRPPIIQIQRRRWIAINRTVMDLITESYSLHDSQVVNGPAWLMDRYDITAVPDGEGQPSQPQWQSMVRKLLADRFQLSAHVEQRDIAVYALTAKRIPQLAPGTGDPAGPANLAMPAQGRFSGRNASMADLARVLAGVLDRPVVDHTGIAGRYDFNLSWALDEFQLARLRAFPVPRGGGEFPELFTALEEQFGFKLESAKLPGQVLVIDKIERPSEN